MQRQECGKGNSENPKQKKLIIACVATGVAIVALAIVLAVLCMNYYSEKETAAENQNTQATTAQNGTSSSNSNSNSNANANSNANSNENNAASNENKGEDAQPQGSSEAQAEESQAQAQPEVETTEQRVAKLTQQLEGEGCTVVAQGEVRRHDDASYGSTNTTYYVWLDQPCTVTARAPRDFSTASSQAIVASPSTNGTFSDKYEIEAYFSPIVGQRVLVGFTDAVQDIWFNTDVPCSLTQHTQSQCDLLNAGRVTHVSNIRIIEL